MKKKPKQPRLWVWVMLSREGRRWYVLLTRTWGPFSPGDVRDIRRQTNLDAKNVRVRRVEVKP